jgi:ubiquinol-cytochrome c reductase iron-sulfur subunit
LILLFVGVSVIRRAAKSQAVVTDERPEEPIGEAGTSSSTASPAEPTRAQNTGITRLPRRILLGAAALLPVALVVPLLNISRDAAAKRSHTIWSNGTRLVTSLSKRPIQPSDLQIGELVDATPETLFDLPESEQLNAKAKAAIVLVRIPAQEINAAEGREDWHIAGIIAYSKICTHVGCPMGLFERTTQHLLCPCHQSTFDLANNGAVQFGPATRDLPQLPLAVDSEGFLVALSDFTEPVGPSYWEREA